MSCYSRTLSTLPRRVLSRPMTCRKLRAIRSCSSTPIPLGVKSVDEIPGPKGWPLLGSSLQLRSALMTGSPKDEEFFYKNHMKYGPIFKIKAGNTTMVSVAAPEVIPLMQQVEGPYPTRIGVDNISWIHNRNKMPESIAFAVGKEWKRIRSAASKQIVPRRVSPFTAPFNEISAEFVDQLAAIANKGGGCVHDLREEAVKFSFQGISYFVFGEKMDVYNEENREFKEFAEAAQDLMDSIQHVAFGIPLFKFFPTKPYQRYINSYQRMRDIGKRIIQRRNEDLKAAIERGTVDETAAVGFIDQWLIEGKFTEEEALMLSCDALGAGVDTTSNATTFMLHELAKNPNVQEEVFQEIQTVMGDRRSPVFEDIQKMILLRGCVRETLRLFPIIPFVPRMIAKPVNVLGFHIPAKTILMYNMSHAGINPKYAEDPLAFKPERWDRECETRLEPFLSVPFGVGPRGCYGRRLSELEMYSVLAEVIPRFKLTTSQQTLKTIVQTILRPNEPVTIRLSPRTLERGILNKNGPKTYTYVLDTRKLKRTKNLPLLLKKSLYHNC